jgi:hypothetical protein
MRTYLIGVTIYQPDVEPSAQDRKRRVAKHLSLPTATSPCGGVSGLTK